MFLLVGGGCSCCIHFSLSVIIGDSFTRRSGGAHTVDHLILYRRVVLGLDMFLSITASLYESGLNQIVDFV